MTGPNLVGRQAETTALNGALQPGLAVALTGVPGAGKSALAQHLFRDRGARQGGVWVDAVGCATAEDVWQAIGSSGGLPNRQQGLVVLDGLDVDALICSKLTRDLLHAHPRLQLLVTTRRRDLGDELATLPVGPLSEADAVALLEAHAAASRPSFAEGCDRTLLCRIVAAVDHNPAEIVGIARGAAALTAEQMLVAVEGLDRGLLSTDEVARSVTWHALPLYPDGRILLARCALFPAGVTLEALGSFYARRPLVALRALVNRSMLVLETRTSPRAPRYRVPGLVMQAAHHAGAADASDRDSMIDWALATVGAARRASPSRRRRELLEELGNLKAAFVHALPERPEDAARVALGISQVSVSVVGWPGAAHTLTALARRPTLPEGLAIRVLLFAAVLTSRAGEGPEGGVLLREAQTRADVLDDAETCGLVALRLGDWLVAAGRREEAADVLARGIGHTQAAGLAHMEVGLQVSCGENLLAGGYYGSALERYVSAVETYYTLGKTEFACIVSLVQAEVLGGLGQVELALTVARRAIASERTPEGKVAQVLGFLHLELGDLDEASRWFTQAADAYDLLGVPCRAAEMEVDRALIAAERGRPQEAQERLGGALDVIRESGSPLKVASTWLVQAMVHLWAGDPAAAGSCAAEVRDRAGGCFDGLAGRAAVVWALSGLAMGPHVMRERTATIPRPDPDEDPVLDRLLDALTHADPQRLSTTQGSLVRLTCHLLGAHPEAVIDPAWGIAEEVLEALERGVPISVQELADRGDSTLLADLHLLGHADLSVLRALPDGHGDTAFWRWAAGPTMSPAELVPWAAREEAAPLRHRRARALLGLPARLDAMDMRVVQATQARLAWTCGALHGQDDTQVHVLDTEQRMLVGPDGGRFEFATTPVQWRLLLALTQADDFASKEDLALAMWSDEDYHPLVHDNRLRVAVFKLRQMLQPQGGDQAIVGRSGAYALDWTVRIVGPSANRE